MEIEMPEAALIRVLRELLGEEQADAATAAFITYLSALGEASYVNAWDDIERTGRTDSEDVMDRAERRSGMFQGTALMLTAYLAHARPVSLADAPPAWTAPTKLLDQVPVPG